ncbi:uncharacterized protein J3D65DRAFT_643209 [Phyllosticta citribraziliensis]|uniref:DUF7907 domain-containing protein n=1 Tax=Phyllosticta citribraziliensis TaxID=989973 RepID=A0ABR1L1V8_9PEZI
MFPQPATFLPLLLPLAAAAPAILDSRGLLNPAPFKLVANVTAFPITPNVTSYEAAFKPFTDKSCMGSVYLVPSGGEKWAQWTLTDNGTTYTTVNRDPSGNGDGRGSTGGIIVTPGGTATVPSANTVNVNACGVGSPGVGIVNNELLGWKDGWTGGWMACPVSLVPGSYGKAGDIVLSVKNEGQRTIYGCSNVDLKVVYV